MTNIAPEWTAYVNAVAAHDSRAFFRPKAPFFHRNGNTCQTTVFVDGKKHYTLVSKHCSRCGGQGNAEQWKHTGYTCYKCGGTGGHYKAEATVYTAEALATLNDRADAKAAKKAAQITAKTDAAKAAFETTYADLVALVATLKTPSDFIANVFEQGVKKGVLSERQIEAVKVAVERGTKKATEAGVSQHVGQIGDRLTLPLTVAFVTSYDTVFGTCFVTILNDIEGNVLVYKGNKTLAPKGEKTTVTATIKEHGDRDGVKQTIISRPKQ
jgi:predicted peroxiredoxin